MIKLMNDHQVQSYRFSKSSRDHQVTLLFKPIASRMESDIEAAMSEVEGEGNGDTGIWWGLAQV